MIIQSLLRIYCQIRFAQYLLQFFANIIIPDHDANVFYPPSWPSANQTLVDTSIERFFSGLRRWDAVHFLHIARYGYIYENSLAFFPTYPLVFIRPFAYLLKLVLQESNSYLLSSILINFFLGFCNTYLIYKIALKYHLTPNHAYWSAILYIINPATIFFIAPYSETLFLFTQLLGHYFLQSHRVFYSYLCFALGSTTRSNGIVSFAFIVYYYLRQRRIFPLYYLILFICPFFMTQYYLYKEYCFEKKISFEFQIYGSQNDLAMPLSNFSSEWCRKILPFSYQYVQKTYWNVGFLKYYTWKQIPNFLLAIPVYLLISKSIITWFQLIKPDLWKRKFDFLFTNKTDEKINIWLARKDLLPHVIYMLFLSCFALFVMHIQVATRFLFSSGPFLYLISADQLKQDDIKNGNLRRILYLFKKQTFLFYYYMTYVIIGICLFSNFLPWT
ncbi:unnamed protein product [Adineta ricciae]|uniref:GPI mannosyltransferase 2 n=1 Tax=Adineta ricciae TaxID=249248 RepID=A0A814KUR0_ADIRI|nr:unnamed protein product [Adineta ricciae]CAF1197665.1 unnamed protein product [Adineta ricciae]